MGSRGNVAPIVLGVLSKLILTQLAKGDIMGRPILQLVLVASVLTLLMAVCDRITADVQLKPSIELKAALTNEKVLVGVGFQVKDIGTKKLPKKFFGEFFIDGVKFDEKDCIMTVDKDGTKGIIFGLGQKITVGKHKLGFSVFLDDKTIVTFPEIEVQFEKLGKSASNTK